MTTFPCTTAPALFDTMGGPDHPTVREAKSLCLTCPAIFMCRQQGRDGREWGVWGGESQVERNQAIGQVEDDDRPECGTYPALMLHRALGEKCEICLEARRERERAYDAKRREGRKLVQPVKKRGGARVKSKCPSYGSYKRHIKLREDPGPCGCREAYRVARAAERAAKPKKERAHAECPSPAAYRRHRRQGESGIECGCLEANRKANSEQKRAKKEGSAA
ncbi:WhiB family transcriptional regulator [Streptomyces sp. NPDC021080]|uniref:WhiB family transcriptional regulator n=1 Tax=Streptomyces sp. NPDC021080 TaxID=3365110 RepID=UPI00378A394D